MKVLQSLCLLDRDEDPFLDQLSARTAELFGVILLQLQYAASQEHCQPAANSKRATVTNGGGSPHAAWTAGWLPGALLKRMLGHAVHH